LRGDPPNAASYSGDQTECFTPMKHKVSNFKQHDPLTARATTAQLNMTEIAPNTHPCAL
jgi:hypothetical protein